MGVCAVPGFHKRDPSIRFPADCKISMGSVASRVCRHNAGTDSEYVEGVVCQADDLKDDEMKVCHLAGHGRVLLVKHAGRISALGTKCSHYGAPLQKGVLANGRVRCPWHGACFNVQTGDIEDFPGLDGIPCYQVHVEDKGGVRVRANRQHLRDDAVTKQLAKRNKHCQDVVLVLGGGGAGASCVEALRQSGFGGRVVLATSEAHLPYDRPKLSKAPDAPIAKIQLRSAEFYQAADIEVLLEHEVVSVRPLERTVQFANGVEVTYTSLVVATGSRPRRLSVPGADLQGVCVLRSPDESHTIATGMPGSHVVVVGSSFIGMEMAAFGVDKAASVTVVGSGQVPYGRSLGPRIGAMLQQLHLSRGVHFRMGLSVAECRGRDGRLTEVVLTDGSTLPAELCLMGVGAMPCTEFLDGVVERDAGGHVVVDEHLRSSVQSILAAGDVASFPLPLAGGHHVAIGHWQTALYLGRLAGRTAAGRTDSVTTVPFFWTQLFGKSVRFTGHSAPFDDVLYDGDVEAQKFVAFFCSGDRVQGVATMGRDPEAARWAEHMARHGYPSKSEIAGRLAAAE